MSTEAHVPAQRQPSTERQNRLGAQATQRAHEIAAAAPPLSPEQEIRLTALLARTGPLEYPAVAPAPRSAPGRGRLAPPPAPAPRSPSDSFSGQFLHDAQWPVAAGGPT